eukprot:SAG31_NODE_18512_length_633_cov_1.142322_1_plen_91_part_01
MDLSNYFLGNFWAIFNLKIAQMRDLYKIESLSSVEERTREPLCLEALRAQRDQDLQVVSRKIFEGVPVIEPVLIWSDLIRSRVILVRHTPA